MYPEITFYNIPQTCYNDPGVMPMFVYLSMIETAEDKDKFEHIYNKYRNLMFHVANKLLNNHHDSEDAVHQAFVSIIKNLAKIDDIDCPKTRSYIVLITERKAIDLMRVNHRDRIIALNEEIEGIEIPLPGDDGIADAIARLPAHYREILLLKFDNGYSNKELSRMIGISESGIRKLIGRAKRALEAELNKEGVPF